MIFYSSPIMCLQKLAFAFAILITTTSNIAFADDGLTDMFYEFRTKCDLSEMQVTVLFNKKFEGILYSKGYSHDPQCRTWASSLRNAKRNQTLHLPLVGCGSRIEVKENSSVVLNTVIVHHHRFLPTEFDMDYEVECAFPERIAQDFHTLFNVTNFEENDNSTKIKTSLEINPGRIILGRRLAKRLKLEDKLLLAFSVSDDGQHNDIRITECVAHNDKAISYISSVIELTNSGRCRLGRSNYLSRFQVVTSRTAIMAFAQLKSMEFSAHNRQLYITCEAELCVKWCTCNRRNRPQKGFTFTAQHRVVKRSLDDTRSPIDQRKLEEQRESTFNISSSKKFGTRNRLLLSTVRVLAKRLMQLKNQSSPSNVTMLNRRVSENNTNNRKNVSKIIKKETETTNNQDTSNAINKESVTASNQKSVTNDINGENATASTQNVSNSVNKKTLTASSQENMSNAFNKGTVTVSSENLSNAFNKGTVTVSSEENMSNAINKGTVIVSSQENLSNAINKGMVTISSQENISNTINEESVTKNNQAELSTTFNENTERNQADLSSPIQDEPITECVSKNVISDAVNMKVLVFNNSENDYEVDVLVSADNNDSDGQHSAILLESNTNGFVNEDILTHMSKSVESDLVSDGKFKVPDTLGSNITLLNVNVQENCVPNLRFLTVSLSLGFIIVCLLLVIIGMYLYIRKERKKHVLSSYLLYSFH